MPIFTLNCAVLVFLSQRNTEPSFRVGEGGENMYRASTMG